MPGCNVKVSAQAMIEPAANVVTAGAARCSHLRVATASAKVTRPAGRTGLLSVDMARLEEARRATASMPSSSEPMPNPGASMVR